MKVIFSLLTILSATLSHTAGAAEGFVQVRNQSVYLNYSSVDSVGLIDLLEIMKLEHTLTESVPNGGGSIDLYEFKTSSSDLRIGGVVYVNENKVVTNRILKINAPMSDEIFASYRNGESFLSISGKIADELFSQVAKHAEVSSSTVNHVEFGAIACHRPFKPLLTHCMVTKL